MKTVLKDIFFTNLLLITIVQFTESTDKQGVPGWFKGDIESFAHHAVIEELFFKWKIFSSWRAVCAASFIRRTWLITSPECIEQSKKYRIVAGTDKRNWVIKNLGFYSSQDVKLMVMYTGTIPGEEINFSLIKVKDPFPYSKSIKKINLMRKSDSPLSKFQIGYVAGFGRANKDDNGEELKVAELRIPTEAQCVKHIGRSKQIKLGQMCTLKTGQGLTDMDIGSGLIVQREDGSKILVGTLIKESGDLVMFSNLTNYIEIIKSTIKKNS